VIFGEENLQKQIVVTLTYNVKGSTSVFTKTKSYDVIINSSPIGVSVSTLKEVTSGQEFDIRVELSSNSKEVLKDIIFEAKYPFGYNYISSTFPPLSNKNTWNIGDIDTHTSSLSTKKEVDFQIALTPNIVHVENTPVLINQATLSDMDRFTNSNLNSIENALTTQFSTNPVYKQGDESVLR
jgi:hypothetical protein